MKQLFWFVWSLFPLLSFAAATPLSVVTTTPDLSWLAKQIGGPLVQSQSLLEGKENPHYMDVSPKFIHQVANASVVCFVGLDLEIGWLPKVLSRSGNAKIQKGGKGYCDIGKSIRAIEIPSGPINRSMGDVHPAGNPHYWLSPPRMKQAAKTMEQYLSEAAPQQVPLFEKNLAKLNQVLDAIYTENKNKLKNVLKSHKGPLLLEYHKEFSYFLEAYGLQSWGSLEEKPGVPPSAGRLAQVAQAIKKTPVRFVLAAPYSPKRTLKKFEELSGLPVVIVPTSVRRNTFPKSYESLQKNIVDKIIQTLRLQRKQLAHGSPTAH